MKTTKDTLSGFSDHSMIAEFMTHQLRTSLNTIIGFSDLLNRKSVTESSKKTYYEYIYNSSINLLLLHDNLRDLLDLDKSMAQPVIEECHLPTLLSNIYQKYMLELEKKSHRGIYLKIVTPQAPKYTHILAEEKKLRRVLENLIENAIDFSQEGIIEFGYTEEADQKLKFFVKDKGAGISLEKLEDLYHLFISRKKTLDVSMDLAAIRAVVAKHFTAQLGGELQSDSVITMGSNFYWSFPVQESERAASKDLQDPPAENYDWSGSSILIAEDVETNFRLVEELLKPTGAKLTWVKSGQEAVDSFSKNPAFDIILMDIIMPEMDGFEAAKAIRKLSTTVPIIAQTAFTPDQNDTESQVQYFNEFLIKPIWWYDLSRLLLKYLD